MESTMLLIKHTDTFHITVECVPYSDDFHTLQQLCDGYIDALPQSVYFPYVDAPLIIGWCDDEGKVKQKDVTLPVYDQNGRMVDVLVGDIVVTGIDGPDTRALTEDEIESVIKGLRFIYRESAFKVKYPDGYPSF